MKIETNSIRSERIEFGCEITFVISSITVVATSFIRVIIVVEYGAKFNRGAVGASGIRRTNRGDYAIVKHKRHL